MTLDSVTLSRLHDLRHARASDFIATPAVGGAVLRSLPPGLYRGQSGPQPPPETLDGQPGAMKSP